MEIRVITRSGARRRRAGLDFSDKPETVVVVAKLDPVLDAVDPETGARKRMAVDAEGLASLKADASLMVLEPGKDPPSSAKQAAKIAEQDTTIADLQAEVRALKAELARRPRESTGGPERLAATVKAD